MYENGSGRLNSNYDLLPAVASGLNIYAVPRAIGNNDAPTPPGVRPDSSTETITTASYATTRYEYDYIFRGGSRQSPGVVADESRPKCTINIHIRNKARIAGSIIDGTRKELARIFGEAGVTITFNDTKSGADVGVTLWLVNQFPDYIKNELASIPGADTSDNPIGFQSGRYYGNVFVRTGGLEGYETVNGLFLGRIGAHEIGHRLLRWLKELDGLYNSGGHSMKNNQFQGIVSLRGVFSLSKTPEELGEDEYKKSFSFLPEEMEALRRCKFPSRIPRGY